MPEVYESAGEDEDTVTGDFGALVRHGPVNVLVDEGEARGVWKWSLKYKKFRGRGPRASEKLIGADGIWEFQIDHGANGPQRKAALFQAKMHGEGGPDLFRQAVVMSTWREAAFVLEYTPDSVVAFRLDDVIAARGRSLSNAPRYEFDEFIIEQFIGCKVGDRDLLYDRTNRRLYWRDSDQKVVAAPFTLTHKFRVDVKPPWYTDAAYPRPDLELSSGEIHLHRMFASPSDILGVDPFATPHQLKRARNHVAQLYHPDRAGTWEEQIREAMNRRMAEANAAYDEASGKRSRRRK